MKLNIHSYNLFYLFICIIWIPVQRYYLHVDGGARSIMVLSLIAVILNYSTFFHRKDLFRSTPFVCWTLLVAFSFINSMVKGFSSEKGTLNFILGNFLLPYVFLVTAIIELDYDQNRCLKIVLIAQLIYIFLGFTNISVAIGERSVDEELGNMLPLTATGLMFVVGVLLCNHQLKGGWLTFGIITTFVITIIVGTATRKALGATVLAFTGVILGYTKKFNLKTLLLLVIFTIVLYKGMDYILESTLIGERLASSSETFDVPLSSNPKVNSFLMTVLGDRTLQYYMVFQMFSQHPVTGVGLNNYMSLTQSENRLHTEYMVQLFENGLIGISLLIVFYIALFNGLNKKRKTGENNMMYLFGILMVLFLNLTAWTYNMHYIMIIYAIIISYVHSTPIHNENSHSSPQKQLQ